MSQTPALEKPAAADTDSLQLSALDPKTVRRMELISLACGVLTIVVALLALIGWAIHKPQLSAILPGQASMKVNAALCLLLAGMAVVLLQRIRPARVPRWLPRLLGLTVLAIASLTLVEYVFEVDTEIEHVLLREHEGDVAASALGRIAPSTTIALIFGSLALLCVDRTRKSAKALFSFALLASALIALLALLGYTFNVPMLYRFGAYTQMSFPTALATSIFCVGLFCLRPENPGSSVLSADSSGGLLLRRLLPLAILVPWILAWAAAIGERGKYYSGDVANLLFAASAIIVMSIVAFVTAWTLDRVDRERRLARDAAVFADRERDHARRRLAAIVESTHDAIIGKSLDGIIESWNAGAVELYGYSPEEIIGKHISVLFPPEAKHHSEEILKLMASGERVDEPEAERVRKDGSRVAVAITVSPIYNTGGKIIGASTIARDVTEQKRAREEITHARAQLDAVLTSMAEGVYQLDSNARLVYMNTAAEYMLGYKFEEIRGRKTHDVIHSHLPDGTYRPAETCPLVNVLRNGHMFHTDEDYFRRKDGTFFEVEYTSAPLYQDGVVKGAVLSFSDITQRKENERDRAQLIQNLQAKTTELDHLNAELEDRVRQRTLELEVANKELEAFSYSVSHDLRSPLRSIDGFSQILLEDYERTLDDEGKDFLRRVRAASQHMGQLIDALLQLSRVTRWEMTKDTVDLSAVARDIAAELQRGAPGRHVDWSIAEGISAQGDARLLGVLMQNIIGNAWKFTSKTPAARIEFGLADRDGKPAYFVRDNGAGFEMAYANKLFAAFQRLHAVTEFEGTGIGLATVQRIIRRHGGTIWAEGQPGKGATFYFTLPN